MTARQVYLVQVLLLVTWFSVAALVRPSLPERIPIHFGLDGTADAWAQTGFVSWFGLPTVALATALLLWGMVRLARRASPELWNVPEKERFLRLTPEQRAPILARLERMSAICGLVTSAMFLAIHVAVYETAMGHRAGLPWYAFAVMIGGVVLILALAIGETQRAGAEIRRASEG